MRTLLAGCFTALVAVGCGAGGRPELSSAGVMAARPQCGALNVACVGQKLDAPIALGSAVELDVRYQIGGSSGPPTVLESADPAVLVVEGSRLKAVGAGASAVLFIGPDKAVLDFLHLWVEPATELRIMRYSSSGTLLGRVQSSIKLLVHDELLVSIEPFAKGQPLLGSFKLEPNVSGNTVAIVPDSVSGWHRVVARSPGPSQVKFSALGLTTDWAIEVMP
ncbi:MAG: hypothetical protein HYV09_38475 [Deltaproteobacteria bacterium]|nr:hypothetical protein [Deltaproteobacteria bacterium]